MSEWKIYHSDGSQLTDTKGNAVTLRSFEMSDEWMGECTLTADITSSYPITFVIGDYVEYRGERFEINYDPGKIKVARAGSYGDAFKYDGVAFNSLQYELVRTEFLDIVLSNENVEEQSLPYTSLPKFTFYVQTLDNLLDRVQANLDEQIGEGKWKIYSRNKSASLQRGGTATEWESVYGDGTGDNVIDTKAVTVDGYTCWQALSLVNSEWDVNFIVRGRNVYVGTTGVEAAGIFKYGLGNGLYEVDQNTDDSQSVITRLRAYGSNKNMPSHYYAEMSLDAYGNITAITKEDITNSGIAVVITTDINWSKSKSIFTTESSVSSYDNEKYSVCVSSEAKGTKVKAWVRSSVGNDSTVSNNYVAIVLNSSEGDATKDEIETLYNAISASKKVYFTLGVSKINFPSSNVIAADDGLPSNMAVDHLMLPGFPTKSLADWWTANESEHEWINPTGKEHSLSTMKYRPYVDSTNLATIGVRSGSVCFDTDNKKDGIIEIYPTIEEMEVDGERIDVIYTGSGITDNGVFKDGQTVPNFSIYLSPKVNFDINSLKNDDLTISMKDGMCAGRDFSVKGSTKENGVWKLTLERTKDESLDMYFPYSDMQINAGDHYVLTGIELPDAYIEAASKKLLKYALAYLDANDYTRYVYQPKVDELFMARQHDKAKADTTGATKSLHDTLKAGDLMHFTDTDLGIDATIVIDKLIIKEGEGPVPTYDITLREDKEVGTIELIQNKISSLESGNGANGGGLTVTQVNNLISQTGSGLFLSKKSPDTAAALIRFLKGIALGDTSTAYSISPDGLAVLEGILSDGYTSGALGSGFCLTMEPESVEGGGKYAYLEVDRLLVRKAAEFLQVVIRELKHVGGEILLSPASMKCIKVENVKDSLTGGVTAYRCYFRKTDNDGTYVDNPFATGDLVRCQRFNLTDSADNAKTFYYWRKCVAVGSDYIELSATDYDTTTANNTPQEGDEMVQLGSATDTTRQSAIVLSSYGADAPSVTMYRGVNSYSLTGREQFQVSASKVLVIADELYFTTDGGKRNVKDAITTIETNAEGMKASIADHGTRLTTVEATASGLKTSVEAHENRITSNENSISTNTSKISDLSTEIDNVSSSIEQTARKISLEVAETTTGLKNMLTGTAFRSWDTIPQVQENYPVTRLAAGGVAGSDCGVLEVSGLSSSQASYCGVKRTVTLTPGKTYTYSFWAKVETVCDGSAYSRIYYEARTTGIRYIAIKATETSDWTRYEWTFECPEDAEEVLLETAISRNGRVLICREMLMEGDTYEGWSLSPNDVTESGSLESKVIKAGIDIEAGKITATADKFEVRNTDGDVTASVNADGLLEVGSGLFTGFVMKKPTMMTPDNIDSLVSKTIQNGYVNVDYIKTGSYIIFSGDMNTKFGSDMPTLVLPTTENDLDTLNVDLSVALQYLGQTFIVKNESNATVNILGGGTIRSIDTPTNQLSNGKYAVLTSTLSYSSGNLSVAWSGYIGK